MAQELSPELIATLLAGVVLAHVALALAAQKINALYLIAGAFLLLSPISAARELAVLEVAKYARVYTTLLIVLVGLVGFRINRLGLASKALMAFVVLYICAASWSPFPLQGLLYKSFFGLAILSGLFLAHGVSSRAELIRGVRFLGMVAGFGGMLVFGIFLGDPELWQRVGRMAVEGLNPNRIGNTAAFLLVLCGHLALYDRSRIWKAFGYFVCGLLAVIIVYTGSRAGLAMAALGFFVLALPLARRPIRLAALFVVVIGFGYVILYYLESPGAARLVATVERSGEITQTRGGMWAAGMRSFAERPLLGRGWLFSERMTTSNLHNMYIQTMVEAGLVGIIVFAAAILVVVIRGIRVYLSMRRLPEFLNLTGLPLALVVAVLAQGVAESGTLTGATLGALVLGFGVGLIDRLPEMVAEEVRWAYRRLRYNAVRRQPRSGLEFG